jgi:hypothetical protein
VHKRKIDETMSNFKVQSSNEIQNSNVQERFFGIYSFGIDLTFEL